MPTELRTIRYRCFTGGCYLSPEAAGSELEGAGSLLCAVSSDCAAGIFIHAAYSAGKPGIETPLFTIPSFLSSNRGDDILFANFSWKQLWENIVWTFTTTWGSGDKSVTNTMVRFGPVYYITDLFFVIGLVSILRRLRGMEKRNVTPMSHCWRGWAWDCG